MIHEWLLILKAALFRAIRYKIHIFVSLRNLFSMFHIFIRSRPYEHHITSIMDRPEELVAIHANLPQTKPVSSENRNGRYSKDHHIVHENLSVEKGQTDA